MGDPSDEDDEEFELVESTGFDFHDLPDGGSFIAPHGWEWLADTLDIAALRIWPNGDISVLSPPGENSAPRWRRYKHGNMESVNNESSGTRT